MKKQYKIKTTLTRTDQTFYLPNPASKGASNMFIFTTREEVERAIERAKEINEGLDPTFTIFSREVTEWEAIT